LHEIIEVSCPVPQWPSLTTMAFLSFACPELVFSDVSWEEKTIPEPEFYTFKEPKNRFQGTNFARLCSLAGRYDNPIPPRFLALTDCLKIPALALSRKLPRVDGIESAMSHKMLICKAGIDFVLAWVLTLPPPEKRFHDELLLARNRFCGINDWGP
jgi:hypothetical protein